MIYFGSYGIGKKYKDTHSFEERQADCTRLKNQYPNRIPVILEFDSMFHKTAEKERFLVPDDLTLAQFMFAIRTQLKLTPAEGVYLMCKGKFIPNTDFFLEIGEKYSEPCGNVFMRLYKENTFG